MNRQHDELQARVESLFAAEGHSLASDDERIDILALGALDELQAGTVRMFADEGNVPEGAAGVLLEGLGQDDQADFKANVSLLFEGDAAPKAADDLLVERLALKAALAEAPGAAPRKSSRRAVLWLSPVAAGVLFGSLAVASAAVVTRTQWMPVVQRLFAPTAVVSPAKPPAPSPTARLQDIEATVEEAPSPPLEIVVPMDGPRRRGKSVLSAAALFEAANLARRAGRSGDAVAQFRTLQKLHPASAEAQISHLSLADLLLRANKRKDALIQLNNYLNDNPQGPLVEEALYRKAKTLDRLGQHARAQSVWREIARRFPASIYREEAERSRTGSPSVLD